MANLNSILKSGDITLPTRICIIRAMIFPVVRYGCESWTIKRLGTKELMPLNCGIREDAWESLGLQGDQTSQSERKPTLNIHWKDWHWSWSSNTLVTWCEELTHWKDSDAGKDWRQKQKRVAEDEMAGWRHWLDGYELEWTLGVDNGQGGLACYNSRGHKESDMTEQLNWTTSMWDECNSAVVWAFFRIAFLWDGNENWPFPVLWLLLSFPNLPAHWVQHFHSIIFQHLK